MTQRYHIERVPQYAQLALARKIGFSGKPQDGSNGTLINISPLAKPIKKIGRNHQTEGNAGRHGTRPPAWSVNLLKLSRNSGRLTFASTSPLVLEGSKTSKKAIPFRPGHGLETIPLGNNTRRRTRQELVNLSKRTPLGSQQAAKGTNALFNQGIRRHFQIFPIICHYFLSENNRK